jgi:hypothetical protein
MGPGDRSPRSGLVLALAVLLGALCLGGFPLWASAQQSPPCESREIAYVLSGRLTIADTAMSAGNGSHDVGPGRIVLRLRRRDGAPFARVQVTSYELTEHFAVVARALLWNTRIETRAVVHAAAEGGVPVAEGSLAGHTATWTGKIRGFRIDGTLSCSGNWCGSFGAPPAGDTPIGPPEAPFAFRPFEFAADWKTFTMAPTLVSSSPKQRSFLSLAGREVGQTCTDP